MIILEMILMILEVLVMILSPLVRSILMVYDEMMGNKWKLLYLVLLLMIKNMLDVIISKYNE